MGGVTFTFVSGIVHLGPNKSTGHYITVTNCPDGTFTSFNDTEVMHGLFIEVAVC